MRASRKSIEQELTHRIRTGAYPRGTRMPSHRQLQAELQASSVTLQLAFDRLVERGYVEPRGAHGTFVARSLPMDSRVAVVFPEEVGKRSWNRFWSTAKRVAEDWREGDIRFKPYCIEGENAESPVHRQLCADVADGALAGIVFVSVPSSFAGSPLLSADIPRVSVSGGGARNRDEYRASVLTFVDGGAVEGILRGFAAAGCRRLGVLTTLAHTDSFHARYKAVLRSIGLDSRREWRLGLPVSSQMAPCARTVTHLLCSGPAEHRPDCLLIADDNLVPYAIAGIQDAGLQVPAQLRIAAHANFPEPIRAGVPCERFGPDLNALLRAAAAEIRHLAGGGDRRLVDVPFEVRGSA